MRRVAAQARIQRGRNRLQGFGLLRERFAVVEVAVDEFFERVQKLRAKPRARRPPPPLQRRPRATPPRDRRRGRLVLGHLALRQSSSPLRSSASPAYLRSCFGAGSHFEGAFAKPTRIFPRPSPRGDARAFRRRTFLAGKRSPTASQLPNADAACPRRVARTRAMRSRTRCVDASLAETAKIHRPHPSHRGARSAKAPRAAPIATAARTSGKLTAMQAASSMRCGPGRRRERGDRHRDTMVVVAYAIPERALSPFRPRYRDRRGNSVTLTPQARRVSVIVVRRSDSLPRRSAAPRICASSRRACAAITARIVISSIARTTSSPSSETAVERPVANAHVRDGFAVEIARRPDFDVGAHGGRARRGCRCASRLTPTSSNVTSLPGVMAAPARKNAAPERSAGTRTSCACECARFEFDRVAVEANRMRPKRRSIRSL